MEKLVTIKYRELSRSQDWLLLVKQVFTIKSSSEGIRYLVTDDLTLDYDRITALYQRRCGAEIYLGNLNPLSLTRNISYELKTFTCRDVKGIPDNQVISPGYQT